MITYERQVQFHEIDAAGFVFFPHFATWAHEAMEKLFSALPGGYQGLVIGRRIGLPAVHLEADFRSPLRYGDVALIDASVVRVGTRSISLRYRVRRAGDGASCAELLHTVVTTDLEQARSCAMPDDVRQVAESHVESRSEPRAARA